jgi:carnitine 3-dehydrogenase
MDTPELTDELLDRIEEQSNAQANGATLAELTALRDACLVSVMHGLAENNYASGEILNAYEKALKNRSDI